MHSFAVSQKCRMSYGQMLSWDWHWPWEAPVRTCTDIPQRYSVLGFSQLVTCWVWTWTAQVSETNSWGRICISNKWANTLARTLISVISCWVLVVPTPLPDRDNLSPSSNEWQWTARWQTAPHATHGSAAFPPCQFLTASHLCKSGPSSTSESASAICRAGILGLYHALMAKALGPTSQAPITFVVLQC